MRYLELIQNVISISVYSSYVGAYIYVQQWTLPNSTLIERGDFGRVPQYVELANIGIIT